MNTVPASERFKMNTDLEKITADVAAMLIDGGVKAKVVLPRVGTGSNLGLRRVIQVGDYSYIFAISGKRQAVLYINSCPISRKHRTTAVVADAVACIRDAIKLLQNRSEQETKNAKIVPSLMATQKRIFAETGERGSHVVTDYGNAHLTFSAWPAAKYARVRLPDNPDHAVEVVRTIQQAVKEIERVHAASLEKIAQIAAGFPSL